MIYDHLNNCALYESMHPLFKKAFDYLKSHDLSSAAPGKIVLDEDKLYINVQEPKGKTMEEARLELHQKYIDIQVILQGKETMGWKAADQCKEFQAPYNVEKDIVFFSDKPTQYVTLEPGNFAIFFPGDGHAPCIGDAFIKKAIVKVLI